MSIIGEITAAGTCLTIIVNALNAVRKNIVDYKAAAMLRILGPDRYVSLLCSRIHENAREPVQKLAYYLCGDDQTTGNLVTVLPKLNEKSCQLSEVALKLWDPNQHPPLFFTRHILNLADNLPSEHPGWRIMSLMVEHTDATERVNEGRLPDAVASLGRLKDRIINGEFCSNRPFAILVWLECRLKVHTLPCDEIMFPGDWIPILKQDVQSTDLISTAAYRSLLNGKIDMVCIVNDTKQHQPAP